MQHPARTRSSLSTVLYLPRLREWRNKRALSQKELAERSGVSRHTIMKSEAGRPAWPQTVRKLAAALRVKVDDLQ
jgi:transcriptional regulator with XRE-family HTH domain